MQNSEKNIAKEKNKLPLNQIESIRFKDTKAVSFINLKPIFFILFSIFILISCREPIGLDSSLNTKNLSDYKYLKLNIGNEFVYEVSERDSNGNIISDIRTEIWKVSKIDTIEDRICFQIDVSVNSNIINKIYISTNMNLVSLYSKFASSLIINEAQINTSNYYDIASNWNIISKYTNNVKDSSIQLIDTIKIFNLKNNSNDIYVRKIVKIVELSYDKSLQNESNDSFENVITNTINTSVSEIIEKIDSSNNVSLYNSNLLFNSNQEIQFSENRGIKLLKAEIKEQFKGKEGSNTPVYISKYLSKKLIIIR